jgi:hypothetical protein
MTGTAFLAAPAILDSAKAYGQNKAKDAVEPFKLKYSSSLGMFQQHSRQ